MFRMNLILPSKCEHYEVSALGFCLLVNNIKDRLQLYGCSSAFSKVLQRQSFPTSDATSFVSSPPKLRPSCAQSFEQIGSSRLWLFHASNVFQLPRRESLLFQRSLFFAGSFQLSATFHMVIQKKKTKIGSRYTLLRFVGCCNNFQWKVCSMSNFSTCCCCQLL